MLLPRQGVGQETTPVEELYVSVGTSIARPHGRNVFPLSHAFDNKNARHSADEDTRVQAPYPTEAWICFALVGIEKNRIGRSKPLPYKGFYLLRV